jgi:hypothetical protein
MLLKFVHFPRPARQISEQQSWPLSRESSLTDPTTRRHIIESQGWPDLLTHRSRIWKHTRHIA